MTKLRTFSWVVIEAPSGVAGNLGKKKVSSQMKIMLNFFSENVATEQACKLF